MKTWPSQLVLAPDAFIDLQMHTIYSDGTWTPEQLIGYLVKEQFSLVAITDHDRVDTVAELQQLAATRQFPILAAVEMSTSWKGEATDVLCYGFDPAKNELHNLTQEITRRQCTNTREVYENLCQKGVLLPKQDELVAILEKPSAQQPKELAALLEKLGYGTKTHSSWEMIKAAGLVWATNDIAAVVDVAHRSGAVCLIAHPGRGNGWTCFDVDLLDELRQEVPIDGLEVYYPVHTPEQIAMYLDYAQKHHLLTSSGSDSHGSDKKPIKYRAELSRNLLERVGVQVR